jgi:hypothetical protein
MKDLSSLWSFGPASSPSRLASLAPQDEDAGETKDARTS